MIWLGLGYVFKNKASLFFSRIHLKSRINLYFDGLLRFDQVHKGQLRNDERNLLHIKKQLGKSEFA